MGYFLVFILGFFVAVFLFQRDEWSQDFNQWCIKKRYNKLLNGIPDQVVQVCEFEYLHSFRNYPLIIGDDVYAVSNHKYWHCNDEKIRLEDKEGTIVGYLSSGCIKRIRCHSGYFYYNCINFSEKMNLNGKPVRVRVLLSVK